MGPAPSHLTPGNAGTEPIPPEAAQTKKPPRPRSLMMSDHSERQASY